VIYLIISLLLLLPLLLGWGKLTTHYLGFQFDSIWANLTMGIVAITIVASVFGFFFPLNLPFEIGIIAIGLVGLVKAKSSIFELVSALKNPWLMIFILLGVGITTFAPFIIDHFGYYTGTIKWLNEFGIVKGISNVSLILGQQSSWHIFQASFDALLDPFLRINLVLYSIFIIYTFENKRWNLLFFIPIFLLFLQSPSPDLPIYIFSILLIITLFKADYSKNYSAIWLLSVFVFTLKPTAFWLPLFVFLMGFIYNRQLLFEVKNIVLTSILLLVFFIKQIWVFGDFIFPIYTHLLDISWKPSTFLLELSGKNGVLKTYDFQYSEAEINSWNTTTRFIKWLTLDGFKKFINSGIILMLLGFGVIVLKKQNAKLILLWICIAIKTIIIFYFSGQYRFMIDAILPIIALIILGISLKPIQSKVIALLGILMVFSVFLFPKILQENIKSFYVGQVMGKPKIQQLIKPLEYSISDFNQHRISNFDFYTPKDFHLMHDVPLPCLTPFTMHEYYVAGVFPYAYDAKNLSKGFYLKKLTTSQKEKIDTILKKYVIHHPIE
jgi:hypothetical protein